MEDSGILQQYRRDLRYCCGRYDPSGEWTEGITKKALKEDSSLKFHLQNAKDHGVTQKEIAAVITHVGFYAGWPKAWAVEVPGEETSNEWCEAVSDEEYGKLK